MTTIVRAFDAILLYEYDEIKYFRYLILECIVLLEEEETEFFLYTLLMEQTYDPTDVKW